MPAKKKQPQLGEPLPLITSYEEWIEKFEDLILKAETFINTHPNDTHDVEDTVKKLRRSLDVLKAPLPTQGEQG